MKPNRLRTLIFLALCCDLGLFSKRLIAPAANLITDALHIPGGVGTSFSLMFLAVAAAVVGRFGCAAVIGAVQSVLALSFGMVGSMGALSPIGYIVPGLVIDVTLTLLRRARMPWRDCIVLANAASALCAALTANLIVFHLRGSALALYLCVSAITGTAAGLLGAELVRRLSPIFESQFSSQAGHV